MSNITKSILSTDEPQAYIGAGGDIIKANISVSQPELKRITLNIGGAAVVNVSSIAATLKADGLPDLPLTFDQNLIADVNQKYGEVEDLLIDADIEGDADGQPFVVNLVNQAVQLV